MEHFLEMSKLERARRKVWHERRKKRLARRTKAGPTEAKVKDAIGESHEPLAEPHQGT